MKDQAKKSPTLGKAGHIKSKTFKTKTIRLRN